MPDANGLPGEAAIGSYILAQQELSRLSLRELARMSQVSNANLSRVERGMHEPSLRVLAAVADALSLPFEDLTARACPDVEPAKPGSSVDAVTAAIRAEPRLSQSQKEALLAVYSSYLADGEKQS
jgi:transcriptional regulator with XRE-family HTH domain